MSRFLVAGLKTEEEHVNNNIKVLTENTVFSLQLQNAKAGNMPKAPKPVDLGVSLNIEETDSTELKDLRVQFDQLVSRGTDPVDFARMIEQEELDGRQ